MRREWRDDLLVLTTQFDQARIIAPKLATRTCERPRGFARGPLDRHPSCHGSCHPG
jgi:hypothetical protein